MHYRDLLAAIPKDVYKKNALKAWSALALDFLLLVTFGLVIVKLDSYLIGGFFGLVFQGLVLTGLFVIGHDAGHRSFSDHEKLNNFVGHLTTSFLGWPFHLWRLAHNIHHLHTNDVKKDIAWEPHTNTQIERMPLIFRYTYKTVRSKIWAFWTGSFFHNFELHLKFFQGKLYKQEDRSKIWFSIFLSMFAISAYAGICYYSAGWYGLVCIFLLPLMGFYFWMTTFTLLHHTAPDLKFLSQESWNKVQAQLDGTINVKYGKFIDFFTHDIARHIPHHISVGIPFYHLKKAHEAIHLAFPERVKEHRFSLTYLLQVLRTCQAIDDFQDCNWRGFEDSSQEHQVGTDQLASGGSAAEA